MTTKDIFTKWIGTWNGTCKTWFEPGVLADESDVTAQIEWVYEGRFVRNRYSSWFKGKPRQGEDLLILNSVTQKVQSSWIDDFHMNYGILWSMGEVIPGGFWVRGEYDVGLQKPAWGWRTEYLLLSEMECSITAYNICPDDGMEAMAVQTVLRRTTS